MDKLAPLKLTKQEIDTSKAREFMNKINNDSSEWPESGWFFVETEPNTIMGYTEVELLEELIAFNTELPNAEETGKNLASKIEDNAEMFVQLEYLARSTDPRDVRDGHVQLMSQLSRCNTALWNNFSYRLLPFTKTTPLYNLASVVGALYSDQTKPGYSPTTAIIIDNKSMKPLCQFFVQLCRDVGLNVSIIYANPEDLETLRSIRSNAEFFWQEPAENIGCTGIIAERSDLDSAIDVFVNSSITAPWRLKQIYIQESIFEDFKSALAAKCEPVGSNYTVGNKTFLVECLADSPLGIPTHAYRTTKELLSLIQTPYLSVWAAETALSHEIALLSPSSTVWINEYATFYGPPRCALSVYKLFSTVCIKYDKLKDALKPWAKLRTPDRLDIIVAAVKASTDLSIKEFLPDLTHNFRSDELIDVTERTLCFGVNKSLGVVKIGQGSELKKEIAMTLKLLVKGNAVVGNIALNNVNCYMNEVQEAGVSFYSIKNPVDDAVSIPLVLEGFKVIRTNYGTIFAN